MEKKIVTVSAICFLMIIGIATAGILIEAELIRRVVVIAGCLVVVWLTTLNFKTLKLMKQQTDGLATEVPTLVHWLQGETWPEVLSVEKLKTQFETELEAFLNAYPDCEEAEIRGYRIWRTEDTERYFDWNNPTQQQILVLMDRAGENFQVFGSEILWKAMEEHRK